MGNAYKQVSYQILAPIFDLQKYSYMFRLQPAAILTKLQYSKTYTALLCDLSIVNGNIYRLVSHYCLITYIIVFRYSSFWLSSLHRLLTPKGFWPPRSPHLSPPDFFIWGVLKKTAYWDHIHTLEEVQVNIPRALDGISNETLKKLLDKVMCRVHSCFNHNGQHIEELL
jgi:hypothetical protein